MEMIQNPERKDWKKLLQRPYADNRKVLDTVQDIVSSVKEKGDEALHEWTSTLDGFAPAGFELNKEQWQEQAKKTEPELKAAIEQAAENIHRFHSSQLMLIEKIETMPGVTCWRKSVGIEKVGLYIPGGSAPLFSTVLMLGIPAQLAGCKDVILCSPAGKDGLIHPAILFAAELAGITRVFTLGGAQAIAAMAYGTETVPSVSKIFGPGNQYVTAAKQLVQAEGVAIDMPAGPSEVCVLADETAPPAFVAADLLSQAEHGPDSQVILVSTSIEVVKNVLKELELQLELLPRMAIAEQALKGSKAILVSTLDEAVDMVNQYAAEHLILMCRNAKEVAERIINAGSVFIGNWSPESVGDYASGTNHTLPTNGFATAYSGVSVDSFVRKITFQELTKEGLQNISSTVMLMAEAEGLRGHAYAVKVRGNVES
jgi:histidinol dehydrogenase